METEPKKTKKVKRRLKPRFFVILAALALFITVGIILVDQEAKLRELNYEEAQLTEEYQALDTEEERLRYMIEYAKSRSYLLQYAREVLGMVLPEDTIFDAD